MAAGGIDLYARVFGSGTPAPGMTASETMLNDSPEAEERAQRVMKDLANSQGAFQAWEGPAREELRYYHGWQWDDIDRMQMESRKRPALSFNEIMPVIDAVSGLERLNRTDARFVTRALDSQPFQDAAGDLASEAVSAADELANADEEMSDTAKEMGICGMAWGETSTNYEHDLNGRIIFKKLPFGECRWDPNARMPNIEDAQYRIRIRKVSRKEFTKLWPDMLDKVDMSMPEMPYGQTEKYELVVPYYSLANQQANPQVGQQTTLKKDVEVIQYQWRDMQPVYRFQDEDSGEITVLDEDKWKRLKDRVGMLGGTPPPAVKQFKPVYRQTEVCRGVELDDPVDLPGGFSLLCLTGKWDDEKKRYYGLVRPMIDPQKTKNKAISSALGFHILNAKGGVIFKTSYFADPIDAKNQWAQPDAWIEANDEADLAAGLRQREPQQMPQELGMFYSESSKSIKQVSGVNEELVGLATGQTPSQTAGRRVQAGLVVLGWYWDNWNRFKRARARITLEFIREYWTQGQYIQVGGDFNSQAIPLIKESLPLDYSLVLDDSVRHNPNLKAQVWADLMDSGVLQALMKFGLGQMILKLLKYSPFPTQIVQDIQREAAENPPQPQQKGRGKQEDPTLTQAKVGSLNANAQKAIAKARMIDQQSGLKLAEIVTEGTLGAHKIRQARENATQKQFHSSFGARS